MSSYVFWPQHVPRNVTNRDGHFVAVGMQLESRDWLVLTVVPASVLKKIELREPYKVICQYHHGWKFDVSNVTLIEFVAPNLHMMQFFSLDPIELSLLESGSNSKNSKQNESSNLHKLMNYDAYQVRDLQFRMSIDAINLYYDHFNSLITKYPALNAGQKNSYSKLWIKILAIETSIKQTHLSKLYCMIICLAIMLICSVTNQLLQLINKFNLTFKSISITIRQFDLRCRQICYFPFQFIRIYGNTNDNKSSVSDYVEDINVRIKEFPCKRYPDYIRFYNTVWLIINDISFGLILSALFLENKALLVNFLHTNLRYYLYEFIRNVTIKLSDNPWGIKLNSELTKFISDVSLWIIDFNYIYVIAPITDIDNLNQIISVILYIMSIMGATFGISLLIDFFSLLTIHVFVCYHILHRLYAWQLNVISSLYYLFCGKKINKLRGRIDYHFFEVDQLLMGTLLFIILIYLIPSMWFFYITFTVMRLLTVYMEIILDSTVTMLNHFPLFALLLRLKDPQRLPGGITIDIENSSKSILMLKNDPLKISLLFQPFLLLMNKIISTFFSLRTSLNILKGNTIQLNRNELYYMLYSSLPKVDSIQFDSENYQRLLNSIVNNQ